MKVQKLLYWLVGIAAALLIILYIAFFGINNTSITEPEKRPVIRVMSTYQERLQQQILEKVASEYSRDKSHPKVEMIFVPKENLKKEFSLRQSLGENQVDIVICENTMVQELIQKEMIREVPVSRTLREKITDEKLWYATRHNGKYYGYPLTCDPYVLYYNVDVFEEKEEDVPTNWEELLKTSYSIKKSGFQSFGIAGKRENEITNLFWIMMCSRSGSFHTTNLENWEDCLEKFQQLTIGGLTSRYSTNYTQEDLTREFASGRIMMMVNQMSMTSVLKSNQTKFKVGIAQNLHNETGGTFWFGDTVCVTEEAGSGALAYAQYLSSQEISERINDTMGTLPVYAETSYKKNGKIYMDDVEKLKEEARPMTYYTNWGEICTSVAQGVNAVISTNLTNTEATAKEISDQVRVLIMSES